MFVIRDFHSMRNIFNGAFSKNLNHFDYQSLDYSHFVFNLIFCKNLAQSKSLQMSAWIEEGQPEAINVTDKKFEDDFVASESSKEFKRLEDSESYLQNLGRLFLFTLIKLLYRHSQF